MTRGVLQLVLPQQPRPDQPNVLHALLRKRAEIAGEIEHAQKRIRNLIVELDHVEATIHLFAPEAKVETMRPKPFPPRHQAFKGELIRLVLGTLREAKQPLTSRDLAHVVMRARGLSPDDLDMTTIMTRRVGSCLLAQEHRGVTRRVDKVGPYQRWGLAR